MRTKVSQCSGLVALLLLAFAAPAAHAAYAPKLEIKIDPSTPSTPIAITSRIIQASGETASKTVKVTFPLGYAASTKSTVKPCSPDQEQADACSPDSQVGSGHAETGFANLDGPVYLVLAPQSHLRLAVHLSGLGGLIKQNVYGDIVLAGGRVNTIFDNLPNTATTLFELKLMGGNKGLTVTPKTCGPGTFDAAFTSQNGEQATGKAVVEVTGCATTPVVSAVSASPKSFKAIKKFSDTQRSGYSTTLRYTLSEATNGSRVKVQKRVKGAWRMAGSFVAGGDQGVNSVKFDGRVRGKPLKPGKYRFVVQTTGKSGTTSQPGTASFTVKP